MIQATLRWLSIIMLATDSFAIVVSLIVAYYIRFSPFTAAYSVPHMQLSEHTVGLIFILPIYLVLSYLSGLYRSRQNYSTLELLRRVLQAHTLGTLMILSILFVRKEIDYSRWMIVIFYFLTPMLTVAGRAISNKVLALFRKSGALTIRTAIIGQGETGNLCINRLINNPQIGYQVVGIISDNEQHTPTHSYEIPNLGTIESLESIIEDHAIEELFIALPMSEWNHIRDIIIKCEYIGVKANIVPDLIPFLTSKPSVDILEGIPVINIRAVPLDDPLNNLVKRTFDILFSVIILTLLSPLLISIAVLIKLSSKGPIFFKQTRVGMNRKQFSMYKFRTMKVANSHSENTEWTVRNDPRRTWIGQFLRSTSLDEFPQFFNVIRGDMSVVGPRPERPFFVDKFKESVPNYMIKHLVRPGITGWAQINGWRGDTDIEERIKHDLFYIEQWHLSFDLQIILKTPFRGMINPNAY